MAVGAPRLCWQQPEKGRRKLKLFCFIVQNGLLNALTGSVVAALLSSTEFRRVDDAEVCERFPLSV